MKRAWIIGLVMAASICRANEIGYIEQFALTPDRAEALEELIPGTEDYYYYHALHAQNEGRTDEVDAILVRWIELFSHTARVHSVFASRNGDSVTSCCGASPSRRPTSFSGDPMVNSPPGIRTKAIPVLR